MLKHGLNYSKSFVGSISEKENIATTSNLDEIEQKSNLINKYKRYKTYEMETIDSILPNEKSDYHTKRSDKQNKEDFYKNYYLNKEIFLKKENKLFYDYYTNNSTCSNSEVSNINTSTTETETNNDIIKKLRAEKKKSDLQMNFCKNYLNEKYAKLKNPKNEYFNKYPEADSKEPSHSVHNNPYTFVKNNKNPLGNNINAQNIENLKMQDLNKNNLNKKKEETISRKPSEKDIDPESFFIYYKDVESRKISKNYSNEICQENQQSKFCLSKHKISSKLRAKMVDWMIEVLSSYKCHDQTFFRAVSLMDLFLSKTQKPREVTDLHLIGVACMFLTSKFEEIYPLKLSVVHEKIAHRKLSISEIKNCESEIISTLQFDLMQTTLYELMTLTMQILDLKPITSKKTYSYLQKVSVYLSKLVMHDYDLLNKYEYTELAGTILFVTFKIIQQIDQEFPIEEKVFLFFNLIGQRN